MCDLNQQGQCCLAEKDDIDRRMEADLSAVARAANLLAKETYKREANAEHVAGNLKAKLYHYTVTKDGFGTWNIARNAIHDITIKLRVAGVKHVVIAAVISSIVGGIWTSAYAFHLDPTSISISIDDRRPVRHYADMPVPPPPAPPFHVVNALKPWPGTPK